MLRPGSWTKPAGESPVRVCIGAPGSRPQSRGEIRGAERGVESLFGGSNAFRTDVESHIDEQLPLVDVRSPEEYRGELHPYARLSAGGRAARGHIPGASNVPWKRATNDDGTFKTVDELRSIYQEEIGLGEADDIVAYCRIGERSSHTWFVLSHLLGYSSVRNYDGSWTEWGNLVKAPIDADDAGTVRRRRGLGLAGRRRWVTFSGHRCCLSRRHWIVDTSWPIGRHWSSRPEPPNSVFVRQTLISSGPRPRR